MLFELESNILDTSKDISSGFGWRDDPTTPQFDLSGHGGVDFGANIGTPVKSPSSGTVVAAQTGKHGAYGAYGVGVHFHHPSL